MIYGACSVVVTLSFISSYWWAPAFWQQMVQNTSSNSLSNSQHLLAYLVMFAFYFCNYFVITFFNTGLIACAIRSMRNESATFADGISDASARLRQIVLWSLIAASVGLMLRIIENQSKYFGALIAGLLGAVFSIASFFVIAIMIIENKNPFSAFAESSSLFKKTWGDRIVSNVGWGLFFFLLLIPIFAFIVFAAVMHSSMGIVLGIFAFYTLMLTQSALQSIFHAALYLYCKNGKAPECLDDDVMKLAFVAKG